MWENGSGRRQRLLHLAAFAAALVFAGCGYIGDPLPPLANIPVPVKDLAAIQRGPRIIAHFTIPDVTTEGYPIPAPLTLDLRVGPGGDNFFEGEWAERARHIPAPEITGPLATYQIPIAEWVGKEVVIGARITAGNGKQSRWSNFVVVPVIAPPSQPVDLMATPTAKGVLLTWKAPGSDFRILRKTESDDFAVVGSTSTPEWTDTTAEFGKPYVYMVQSVVKMDQDKTAESDLSQEAAITMEDKFAPAVPVGLRVNSAPASIELAWERNTEADLAGYRIYRATGNGPMEKLAEISLLPTYSDRAVEHGKIYRYAITSVDRAGNESERTGLVEAVW